MARRLLRIAAAAERLDVHPSTVYRLVYARRLTGVPVGTGQSKPRIRIDEDELEELMAGKR